MKQLSRILFFILFAAVFTSCETVSVEERIARIENEVLPTFTIRGEAVETGTIAERMEHYGVPGVSIAVINNGRIEWAKGYGMADVETQRPVTTETLFQAASISKPVAAMAALDMAEAGILSLDEDVNTYLDSWQLADNEFTSTEKVTLRRLLNHTAGTTVWGFGGYARTETVPSTVGVLEGKGNSDPIEVFKKPGESWRYSGGGYTVMQLMLKDLAGKPFPEIMQERVLGPAGMTHSTYRQPLPDSLHDRAATGYRNDSTVVEGKWHVYPEMAAAGLWTTPSDLARYALEVQRSYAGEEGTILSQQMTREMLVPGMNGHGLGPGISEDSLRFGHGGANEGFRCRLTAFIENGSGVVVMTNSDNGDRLAGEIIGTIGREYGWEGVGPEEKVLAVLDAADYEAVAGTYRLSQIGELQIVYEEGKLIAKAPFVDGTPELLPETKTDFFLREDGTPVTFVTEEGSVTGIVVAGRLRGTKLE